MADRPSPAGPAMLAGLGLKPEHYLDILESRPKLGWFEVHPENYMGAGGLPHHYLERIRAEYPLSLHGVGLSIGGAGSLSHSHLARFRAVIERYQPMLVSEHLAWSSHGGDFFNDLLPLPYTAETLRLVAEHVDAAQTALGRQILIENPATYLGFASSSMSEPEFLAALVQRTGCGLLLDLNNLHVSASNHGFDALAYLAAFPIDAVQQLHLAGHARLDDDHGLLVDSHDAPVADVVWLLYAHFLRHAGCRPTLIEWDGAIPAWPRLLAEARRADAVMAAGIAAEQAA